MPLTRLSVIFLCFFIATFIFYWFINQNESTKSSSTSTEILDPLLTEIEPTKADQVEETEHKDTIKIIKTETRDNNVVIDHLSNGIVVETVSVEDADLIEYGDVIDLDPGENDEFTAIEYGSNGDKLQEFSEDEIYIAGFSSKKEMEEYWRKELEVDDNTQFSMMKKIHSNGEEGVEFIFDRSQIFSQAPENMDNF